MTDKTFKSRSTAPRTQHSV